MFRYHIHPVTGVPSRCNSKKGNCPFGNSEEDHYHSKEEARSAYEKRMELSLLPENIEKIGELKKDFIKMIDQKISLVNNKNDKENFNPDLVLFFKNAKRSIENENDSEGFNRLASLYEAASLDAYDEGRIDIVVASGLIIDSAEEMKRPVTALKNINKLFNNVKLNKKIIDNPQTGATIKVLGHEVTLITETGDKRTIREILTNKSKDGIYIGKVSKETNFEALKIIENNNRKLIESFSFKVGSSEKYMQPDKNMESNNKEFEIIGAGAEYNAYLHIPTQMVYKLPHKDSRLREKDSLESAVIDVENAYKDLNKDEIKKFKAEYVSTNFTYLEIGKKVVPVIVQPYLDPEIYIPYSPMGSTKLDLGELGLSDMHEGNVRINIKTKEIVLFDCLFYVGNNWADDLSFEEINYLGD